MTRDNITLAIRMIARGLVNHESVHALTDELERLCSKPAEQAEQEAATQPDPKPDRMALSPKRKR